MAGAVVTAEEGDLVPLPLELEGLSIGPAAVAAGDRVHIKLTWKGQSAARNPSESLMSYFRSVLDAAAGLGRVGVSMHFEQMDYFNSVTIASVIQVIKESGRRQVPLVLVYDRKLKWQELTFRPVRMFVKGDGLFQLRAI